MIIIFTLVFFIACIYILNVKYINTNGFKNKNQQLEKFNNVPKNLKIVCTGSSYAKYGIDFSVYDGIKGFNFALAPQSLNYDFKILKNYAKLLDDNCIVLIVIPDMLFGFRDYENKYIDFRYYKFLNPKYINDYSKVNAFLLKYLPILKAGFQIKYLVHDEVFVDEMKVVHYWKNEDDCTKFAEERIMGWQNQFKLKRLDVEFLNNRIEKNFTWTTNLLKDMLKYCINMKWQPILVIPPCSKILNDKINKNFMNKVLYQNIKRANVYNVPVIDYLYDVEFSDYKLYLWADCLNPEGRKIFTKRLQRDINKIIKINKGEV